MTARRYVFKLVPWERFKDPHVHRCRFCFSKWRCDKFVPWPIAEIKFWAGFLSLKELCETMNDCRPHKYDVCESCVDKRVDELILKDLEEGRWKT